MAARKNEAKIKFIAETKEFTEQINKATQNLSEIRSELKLVQERFKGAENSVEALTEKKKVLQRQLEASADKVEGLRKKLEQAKAIYGENSTEVSRLKTQLNNAERQFVQTENEINATNNALDELEQESRESGNALEKLEDGTKKASDGFTVMKGVISNLVTDGIRILIDGLKDVTRYALTTGSDFEAAMSEVEAISGSTASEMELLTAEAMRVGEITKFSGKEAADGLTYMAMAGWKADDMLAGLEGMANLAAAANSDLGTASDIVTDTLTAMGYAAGDSARLADVMAAASSNANTNVELMGYTFKYAAPVAGSLGYSMEDLAIATGLMANAGIKGEQAGTTLRGGLTNLIKPTQQMATYMDTYGISIKNSDGTVKSLSETMILLRDKMGDLSEAEQAEAAAAIFGKEAMSGWLALINTSDEEFEKLSTAIYGSEGAAKKMASTMQDNLKGDVEELGGAFDTLVTKIYNGFSGSLREGVQAVHAFITGGISMTEMFQRLGGAIGSAWETIKASLPKLKELGKELLVNIINGIVEGVPLLITSAANLVKSLASGVTSNAQSLISKGLDLLNRFADGLVQAMPALVKNGMEFIRNLVKGLMNSLPELISRVPEIISKFASVINDNAPTIIAGGIGIIKDLIVGIIKAIPTLIANIPQILKAIWDTMLAFNWLSLGKNILTGIGKGFTAGWNAIKGFFSNIWTNIKGVFSGAGTWFKNTFTTAWNAVKNAWSGAKSFFSNTWTGIKGAFSNVGGWFKNTFTNAWNGVKNAWSGAKSFFSNAWSGIKGAFSTTASWFKTAFSKAWEGVKWAWANPRQFFSGVWDGIKKVFSAVDGFFGRVFGAGWTKIKQAFSEVGSFFSGVWNKIKNIFSNVGTSIANAVTGAVKGAVNKVLSVAVKTINGFISAINFAIGIINAIPGVNIRKLSSLSVPQLAKGGVIDRPTFAQLGEYRGARTNPEIATPQNIMRETFEDVLNSQFESSFNLERLASAIEDLASRPIRFTVGDRDIAEATAGASDSVSGNRLTLRNRGLALT